MYICINIFCFREVTKISNIHIYVPYIFITIYAHMQDACELTTLYERGLVFAGASCEFLGAVIVTVLSVWLTSKVGGR